MGQLNVFVTDESGKPIENVDVLLTSAQASDWGKQGQFIIPNPRMTDASGKVNFINWSSLTPLPASVMQATASKSGYISATKFNPVSFDGTHDLNIDLVLKASDPFPSSPTRDRVCSVRLTFQGLTVNTKQYGNLPWFEAAISSLTPEDRKSVYRTKRAAGDTHCIVPLTWNYGSPGQPYANIPGTDLSQMLPVFEALVYEVIKAGFTPLLMLGGDGQGNGPGYNDPVGFTYGYDWLYRKLPEIVNILGELNKYVLYCPGWDGVFYGWSPEQVTAFGRLFRELLPDGYLAIEHNTGHIPIGNADSDWVTNGPMQNYDVLLSEFDDGRFDDSVWQVAARCLGPGYKRPSDQPAGDDTTPPYYMRDHTPRGPYYPVAFEFYEYGWVRGASLAAVVDARQYFYNVGYKLVC